MKTENLCREVSFPSVILRAGLFTFLFVVTNTALALFLLGRSGFVASAAVYTAGTLTNLYLLFHPRNQFFVFNRSRVRGAAGGCLALTFDDGPTASHTPELLRILGDKGVKATFFVVGRRAEEQPELLRRIVAEGHAVANHTYSHPNLFCFLRPERLRAEIEKTQQAIEGICGISPRYFRSPVGLRHPLLYLYLTRAGLEFISWRVRAFDTLVRRPETIASRITRKAAAGDVILLHDGLGHGVKHMLAALPGMIDDLRKRGFEFVLV